MIRPNIKRTTNKMGRTDDFIFLILFAVRYFEVKIIKPNLANSLGWIPKEPIPNQLREPFLMVPMPGINTNIRRMIFISRM